MAWTKAMAQTPLEAFQFRELTDEEEKEFVKYADETAAEANVDKIGVYHPVIIKRWMEQGFIPKSV